MNAVWGTGWNALPRGHARERPRGRSQKAPQQRSRDSSAGVETAKAQGVFVASLKTFPSFITKPTFSSTRTSFSGSPETATMSA